MVFKSLITYNKTDLVHRLRVFENRVLRRILFLGRRGNRRVEKIT